MTIRITPRLGRLLVRDHCSFFWAEHREHRVVQVAPSHCEACKQELRENAARTGITLDLVVTNAATTEILEEHAAKLPHGKN